MKATNKRSSSSSSPLLPSLLSLLALLCASSSSSSFFLPTAQAYTDPEHTAILLRAKESLSALGPNWRNALASWQCPSSNLATCDPCGNDFWGNFSGIGCRGEGVSSQDVTGKGRVTNLHFTKSGGEANGNGELPLAPFCALGVSIKEFDITVGDAGTAATPAPPITAIPASLATCFPNLHKLKVSFNSISGPIPVFLATMERLSYLKARENEITGPIPQALASSPRMFYVDLADNKLSGELPVFSNPSSRLGVLDVSGNGAVTGRVDDKLAGVPLMVVGLKGTKTCGPVPSSVRWSVGYDAAGTGLGKPCPSE